MKFLILILILALVLVASAKRRAHRKNNPKCHDLLADCANKDDVFCLNSRGLARTYCPKKCGVCAEGEPQPSPVENDPLYKSGLCHDLLPDCANKGDAFCLKPTNRGLARTYCPMKCGVCKEGEDQPSIMEDETVYEEEAESGSGSGIENGSGVGIVSKILNHINHHWNGASGFGSGRPIKPHKKSPKKRVPAKKRVPSKKRGNRKKH